MSEAAAKLEACPFCGSTDRLERQDNGWDGSDGHTESWDIYCGECEFCVHEDLWNTRASPWIPVGDRLPEEGVSVLLTESWNLEGESGINYDVGMLVEGSIYSEYLNSPTHWKPLDAPPETKT